MVEMEMNEKYTQSVNVNKLSDDNNNNNSTSGRRDEQKLGVD